MLSLLCAALQSACSRSEQHAPGPPPTRRPAVAPPSPSAKPAPLVSAPPPTIRPGGKRSVSGQAGVVTSVEAQATHAGVRILEAGGNAVDAAVAVGYALAVTHPSAGNIGGGGFMLVKLAGQPTRAVDFREIAPRGLTRDAFRKMIARGGIGPVSVGVPGSVAGLNLAQASFGRLPRAKVLKPAIQLAQSGHIVSAREALTLRWSWAFLKKDPGARATFANPVSDEPVAAGVRLKRPDLAATLERVSELGDAGFYDGTVATTMLSIVRKRGGLLEAGDLRGYRAVLREPLRTRYRGLDVEVMPPPSAGGVVVVQDLLMLEQLGAHREERGSASELHAFIEASRRAQAERRFGVVDPDSLPDPERQRRAGNWLSPRYLLDRSPAIDLGRATPSERVHPLYDAAVRELEHTTHFAVSDADGNVVSCTMTLSASFGSKILVPGTGVVLNNAVGSFASAGENVPTASRRTTSSMAPTLVLRDGKPVLVLGSPGGDTIPSTIVQVLRNVIDHGLALEDAVDAGRVHHGFVPDQVSFESHRRPSKAALAELKARGHKLTPRGPMGDANSILLLDGRAYAYADRREGGLALAARAAKAR
ncbi:MAG TPA: gamma-glutamyltransferase [Polyangiaceae bacterium]